MSERAEGAVFAYPYLWTEEKVLSDNPKDRTTCLLIRKKMTTKEGASLVHLFLLGISDNPRSHQSAIEVPLMEKRRAGLDPERPAFIVTSEYNYDVLPLSWHYDRNSKDYGAFSATFTNVVTKAFLTLMKGGRTSRAERVF